MPRYPPPQAAIHDHGDGTHLVRFRPERSGPHQAHASPPTSPHTAVYHLTPRYPPLHTPLYTTPCPAVYHPTPHQVHAWLVTSGGGGGGVALGGSPYALHVTGGPAAAAASEILGVGEVRRARGRGRVRVRIRVA